MPVQLKDFMTMKGFKLGHVNIRSMLLKMVGLTKLVKLFDIMCVSESWLNSNLPNSKVYIPDYQIIRLDRQVVKTGGGLICYVKDTLSEYCNTVPTLCQSNKDIEIQVINITQPKHRLLSIIHVYRPPDGICAQCIKHLVETCKSPLLEGRELWVVGDINVELLDTDHWKTRLYEKCIAGLPLNNQILEITRPNPNPNISGGDMY